MNEKRARNERRIQMFKAPDYPAYVMFNTGKTDSHTDSCKRNNRKEKFTEGHLISEV